MTTSPNIA